MDRRRFLLTPLAGAVAAPLAAAAQQVGNVWRVGYILASGANENARYVEAFRAQLKSLGYVEGINLRLEMRFAEGRVERADSLVTELLSLKLDVLVTGSTRITQAAKRATSVIPIVMIGVGDPLQTGLVSSFARPGGNVTGVALHVGGQELLGKRLDLLTEIARGVSRVGILYNPGNPSNVGALRHVEAAAQAQRTILRPVEVRDVSQLNDALLRALHGGTNGLFVFEDPVTIVGRRQIIEVARQRQVPAIYGLRIFAEDGGLISYGASLVEHNRLAAEYVDKILRGAKPSDLPVHQPRSFELIINLKTAKALGLTVPPSLLLRADQVME